MKKLTKYSQAREDLNVPRCTYIGKNYRDSHDFDYWRRFAARIGEAIPLDLTKTPFPFKVGELVPGFYEPVRRDDLAPGANLCIGKFYRFNPLWIIEAGPYAKQWALQVPAIWDLSGGQFWVPAEDVRLPKILSVTREWMIF